MKKTLNHKCKFCNSDYEVIVERLEKIQMFGPLISKCCNQVLFKKKLSQYSYEIKDLKEEFVGINANLMFFKELNNRYGPDKILKLSKAVMKKTWNPVKCIKCKKVNYETDIDFNRLMKIAPVHCPCCNINLFKEKRKSSTAKVIITSEKFDEYYNIVKENQVLESKKLNANPRKYIPLTKREYSETVTNLKSGFILKKPK